MRVLITGAGGFLGRAVVERLLRQDVAVVALDLPGRLRGLPERVARVSFDFSRQPECLADHATGGDRLLHLGCTSHPAASMDDPGGDAAANVVASVRLFQAAAASGVRRVVFASSGGTVYGRITTTPVTESHPLHPLSAYGVSKMAVEHYLQLFTGLEGISLRVANPYGAGQLRGAPVGAIARFVTCARDARPVEIWGDGSVVRDYIAVDDAARAFELALLHDALPVGAYNIGTGQGTTLNQVIDLVRRTSGRLLDVRYSAARVYDVPAIVLDSTRFSKATGWTPGLDLEVGVKLLWEAALRDE